MNRIKADYKIYTLSEEQDRANVRYVGATVLSLKKRLKMHIKDSKHLDRITQKPRDKSYKAKWIRKCLRENKSIIITQIDSLPYYDEKLEIKWIKKYRELGYRLTNTSNGGKAFMLGKHHSIKTKKRLREARLGVKVSEAIAQKTRGGNNGYATPILQYSKDGKFIKRYDCINSALRELGKFSSTRRNSSISVCASQNKRELQKKNRKLGKCRTYWGYVWQYEK